MPAQRSPVVGGRSPRRPRPGAGPAPVDLFLDGTTLLTTSPQPRGGQLRPLPHATGVAPGRVWRVGIGADLPARVAALLTEPAGDPEVVDSSGRGSGPAGAPEAPAPPMATARALAVAELVAMALDLAHGPLVPIPGAPGRDGACRWEWRATPDAATAARRDAALAAAVAHGAVLDPEPDTAASDFLTALVAALVPSGARRLGLLLGPAPERGPSRTAAVRWAEQVRERRAANARLGIAVGAPEAGESGWTLVALAIALAESTTRMPLALADPGAFGAGEVAWSRWRATESAALVRAWGSVDCPGVREALVDGYSLTVGPEEVVEFLDRVAPRLMARGFDVVAPDGLLRPATVRRRVRATSTGPGVLGADSLGLAAEVLVDGEVLTDEEFRELAAAKGDLVAIRGRWVRVDAAQAARIGALAERLSRPTAVADLLVDEAFTGVELDEGSILAAGLHPARQAARPPGVTAVLRPYQLAGLSWLGWLADNGIGGILADDMGLGKTVQVLASIAADPPGRGPTLVVCPVTLIDTWVRQSAQFTPALRVIAHHGSGRGSSAGVAQGADVVVTTYGILARDPGLAEVAWHRVVLDEAQAIKNPDTHAARAARALRADLRVAVTGTPVENHVGDLWSLMAFAQPGLLPRRKAFEKRFLAAGAEDLALLRSVVSPFVLRRAKTDPGILPDLPDREVIRRDATLTREQVGAYEAVVADMLAALAEMREQRSPGGPGIGRRATVLGSIARLKQICVHPALLTESRTGLHHRSGKVDLLTDLCAEITDEGQAVVVFTQFASFVPDLAAHLRSRLGVEVATLTGSDSRAQRTAVVSAFSDPAGPPILVASLRAGGTGLTLVRANHVIHLDRWWNPAVEDQASDRVWRIGQDQKVSVHVLVCPGTLEDRIDQALAAKRRVAGAIVRSTDTAITELSDGDLADLVSLVRDRVLA